MEELAREQDNFRVSGQIHFSNSSGERKIWETSSLVPRDDSWTQRGITLLSGYEQGFLDSQGIKKPIMWLGENSWELATICVLWVNAVLISFTSLPFGLILHGFWLSPNLLLNSPSCFSLVSDSSLLCRSWLVPQLTLWLNSVLLLLSPRHRQDSHPAMTTALNEGNSCRTEMYQK